MSRRIVTVMAAVTGDAVAVGEDALIKALRHFEQLSITALLALLRRTLMYPSNIFVERTNPTLEHHLFYRLEAERFSVAIVKRIKQGAFLCTFHPTGKRIRNKHKLLEKIR